MTVWEVKNDSDNLMQKWFDVLNHVLKQGGGKLYIFAHKL